jgi:hypothetical protein
MLRDSIIERVLDLLRLRRIAGRLRTNLHKLLAFLDRNFATFSSRSSWPATNAGLSQDASTVRTGHAGFKPGTNSEQNITIY